MRMKYIGLPAFHKVSAPAIHDDEPLWYGRGLRKPPRFRKPPRSQTTGHPAGAIALSSGEVAERSNAPHSKCGLRATVTWVRIPPSPPRSPWLSIFPREAPQERRSCAAFEASSRCGREGKSSVLWPVEAGFSVASFA